MALPLPPNVSAETFRSAVGEFTAVVGAQWVFTTEEDVMLYRDSYSIFWGEAEERIASAAVAPASVEQVQQIVRIANKYKIPLYSISTGRNLTYGGSSPTLRGSVIVDLKRMNKILAVDEKRHFALVEPGVSYFDLYNYIKEHKLKVMLDIPDPGWGSPVGNSLDHGVGYTMGPFRDHFGSHCGMEVVTAEGEIIRTGNGAIPNTEAWQDYHYGAGPTVDGLFAQSNFGIVTKMGFWLMPLPETYLNGTVTVPRYQDFQAMIDEVSYLEDSFLIGMPQFGSPAGGGFFAPPPPELGQLMQGGWPTTDQLEDYVRRVNKPAWSVTLQFYGPEETVRANWAAAKRRFAKAIPGAQFQDGLFIPLPVPPEAEQNLLQPIKTALGIPSLEIFFLTTRNPMTDADPWDGHADFFAFVPRTAKAVHDASKVMWETYREMGAPPFHHPFMTPINYYSRSYVVATIVPTWKDPAKNARSRALFSRLIDRSAENGWGCYRTSPAYQAQVVSKYSFNNSALLKFQEKLKDGIDPNGILSPGRYGIWPANMPEEPGMKRVALVVSLIALAAPVVSQAAAAPVGSPDNGKLVYEKWCLPCHGSRVNTGFPGTTDALYPGAAALAVKYKGTQPPLLTDRTNLTPELVKTVVRNGISAMPRSRKTEISDAELNDIAAYLTQKKKK